MKILLANPRGFCAGVRMAIEVVDQVLKSRGAPVWVYHEIVHNTHVVEDFKRRGVVFVEDVDDVPEGEVVVFSAHGIPPTVRRQAEARGLEVHDATCPLVTKVHNEVIRYARQGYTIVFVGDPKHQEAIGTAGEAPDKVTIVKTAEEVEHLSFPDDAKLAYVTQTTLSVTDANRVIDALKARFPQMREPPKEDICYATTNRQEAVSLWSPEVDLVLVVGSETSSNTKKLVARAEEAGTRGHRIEDAGDMRPEWFEGVDTVLVTAGASAPEHLVEDVVGRIVADHGATIETRTLTEEDMKFALPRSTRQLAVIG